MGKKLIIKGADFSANAIPNILPTSWDYEIEGFTQHLSASSQLALPVGTKWVDLSSFVLYHKTDNGVVEIAKTNGMVLKVTNNLFAVWDSINEEFSYLTENENDVTPNIGSTVYKYTSPNTFEEDTSSGWYGATMNVNAGDIIIYSGKGGSSFRTLGISNTDECEFITLPSVSIAKNVAYAVETAGVMYYNYLASSPHSLQVLRG